MKAKVLLFYKLQMDVEVGSRLGYFGFFIGKMREKDRELDLSTTHFLIYTVLHHDSFIPGLGCGLLEGFN